MGTRRSRHRPRLHKSFTCQQLYACCSSRCTGDTEARFSKVRYECARLKYTGLMTLCSLSLLRSPPTLTELSLPTRNDIDACILSLNLNSPEVEMITALHLEGSRNLERLSPEKTFTSSCSTLKQLM